MNKIIKSFIKNVSPGLLVMIVLVIDVSATAQKKNTTGLVSVSATNKKACGDYPNTGVSVYSSSILTAGEDCNTTITESSSTVYFTAREKIIFYPGFKAVAGSNFVARIDSSAPIEMRISEPLTLAETDYTRSVSVSPNPFTGNLMAVINAEKAGKATVSVYNTHGSKLKVLAGVSISKGINKISVNYSDLPPGVYMLEVNFGGSKMVKKIIRESNSQ